jgi:hypothetical protein
MRSSAGPEEPVSVADLLGRHGQVLTERGAPLPVPAPRRPLSGRMRRTLVAVGSVLAAGSVLGGAVAVTTTGHDTPLSRTPGGLFDQLDPGRSGSGAAGDASVTGAEPRAAVGAPAGRTGPVAATGAVPAPRAAPGPTAAPSAAPTIVVPRTGGGATTGDRSDGAPAARVTAPSVRATVPTVDAASPGPGAAAQTGATTAPTGSGGGGGPVTGLVGGVGKTVSGLLGG